MLEKRIKEKRNQNLFLSPFHKIKIERMIPKLVPAHQPKHIERENLARLSDKTLKRVNILIDTQESLESI